MKLWNIAGLNRAEAGAIQSEYGLPAIIAMLLQTRNIKSAEEIDDFLNNESFISSPFEIKDMDKAAKRVQQAIDSGELICVYGDYDADGVTSTALLYSYLETVGANVIYYIPSRENEGYGMNTGAVDTLAEKGVNLIVTVDNGIAAAKEIDHARTLGIDTVVTDHHMPLDELPNACAVVDLHRTDCPSKFKQLSGVGVAFKLIMALEGEFCDTDMLLDNYADLLALGTIGDIVELRVENRVFVKRGLQSMQNSDRPGIAALIENSGLSGKPLTAGKVSFTLVPRINAVGRLGLSGKSVELLLTEDYDEARQIAAAMGEDNTERRQIETEILQKIDLKIQQNPSLIFDRVIVIDGENWHQGVIGIVASRVKETYGKPAIIISRDGENAKASGRSVEGFALCDAVAACSDLLTHYGGHPMAVGLSLKSDNIELFRKRINEYANSVDSMPFDALKIDCKLNPAGISLDIAEDLTHMQPFGAGNPTPIFGLYNMKINSIIPLSNNKHLKLIVSRGNSTLSAMLFFTSTEEFPYQKGDAVDLAVTLDINEYNGNKSVSIIIKDIKAAADNTEEMLKSQRIFEGFCRSNMLDREQLKSILPSRDDFAVLYRFLRANGGYSFSFDTLVYKLGSKLSLGKIRVALEAMNELGLITISEGMNISKITVNQVSAKVNLEAAAIIKRLTEVTR